MRSVQTLKEQARRHEQKEEWRDALQLYRRAIDRHDDDDPMDISLFNRVGDLQTRLGNLDAASQAYEKSVDLYLESELPNSAIAVCKKMVRHLPGRPAVYLRMGQIRARQGFLVDARQNVLTYAERMQNLGDLDEAFRALIEFADLAADNAEIRLAIATQMQQHDRTDEALEQLAIGYGALLDRGWSEEADEFAERIRALDPQADLDELLVEVRSAAAARAPADEPSPEVGVGLADIELSVAPEPGLLPAEPPPEATPAEVAPDGFEITSAGDGDDSAGGEDPAGGEATLEGFQPTTLDGLEVEKVEEEKAGEDRTPLPLLGDDEAGGEAVAGAGAGAGDPGGDLAAQEPAAAEDAAEEAAAATRADAGHHDGPVEKIQRRAEDGDLDGALEVARDLVRAEPDEVAHHQRLVELAFRADDDEVVAESYLGLAGALRRSGEAVKARAVFQQVLSVDPANETARAALAAGEAAGAGPVQEVASSEDYVDLGALVLDEEGAEKTTRFVVAYEEPSGDEAADFAKMLGQFKEKVAENVATDDVRAHHDLGTAYKEMGLHDEAIQEYQQALRASASHLPTYELLGQCFMEKGEYDAAIRSLSRALDAPQAAEDDLIGIYYYLGCAHEAVGKTGSALEYYDRVFTLDINFADVTERVRALR